MALTAPFMEVYNTVYNNAYDYLLGNDFNQLSTPYLFLHSIKKFPPQSKFLDFGCGNGMVYKNPDVRKIILERQIKAVGIDIDAAYVERCKTVIDEEKLSNNIEIKCQDLFKYQIPATEEKFDFVIFSESAPLMSNELITMFSKYIVDNLLKKGGKLVFINNLTPASNTFVHSWKPMIKYFTMVDFGRLLCKEEFESMANTLNMKAQFSLIVSERASRLFKMLNVQYLFNVLQFAGFQDYDVEQYEIILEAK